LGLILASVLYALVNLTGQVTLTYENPTLILATLAWALINAAIVLGAIRPVLRRQYRRQGYRFPSALPATLHLPTRQPLAGAINNLSLSGGSVTTCRELALGDQLTFVLPLPDAPLILAGEVRHRHRLAVGDWQYGCRFRPLTLADRNRLVRFLYVTATRQPTDTPSELLHAIAV
ncbi:MAG TPA: PilZ domain-containing protein, partial [Chloroflexota bacterium]|nr:PilZ domain-containing protein [Chloroflexota bacterium]